MVISQVWKETQWKSSFVKGKTFKTIQVGDSHTPLDSEHPEVPKFPQCPRGTDDTWKSLRSASSTIWMSWRELCGHFLLSGLLKVFWWSPRKQIPVWPAKVWRWEEGWVLSLCSDTRGVEGGREQSSTSFILHLIHSSPHLPQEGSLTNSNTGLPDAVKSGFLPQH